MTTQKPERPSVTNKLNPDQRHVIIVPGLGSFGTRFALKEVTYHSVPHNYRSIQNPAVWRILLKFGEPAPRIVVGLDIYGDVALGRGSEGPRSPDIDFSNLNAQKLGVSRRHALLRPTPNKLFLIDLDSTNGTYVNAIPVGKGMAQMLKHGDTVALSGLNFVVEIANSPGGTRAESEDKTIDERKEGEGESKTLTLGEEISKTGPLPSMERPKVGEDTLLLSSKKVQQPSPGRETEAAKEDNKRDT